MLDWIHPLSSSLGNEVPPGSVQHWKVRPLANPSCWRHMPELLGCTYIRPQKILPVTATIIQPDFYCWADKKDLKAVKPLPTMVELTSGCGSKCVQTILHPTGVPEDPKFTSALFGDLQPTPPREPGWEVRSLQVRFCRLNFIVRPAQRGSLMCTYLPPCSRLLKSLGTFVQKKCKN